MYCQNQFIVALYFDWSIPKLPGQNQGKQQYTNTWALQHKQQFNVQHMKPKQTKADISYTNDDG